MKSLYEFRTQHGYSCQFMANKLGISKTYYWQIEKGTRRISYDLSLKLASVFRLMPDDLLYEDMRIVIENRGKKPNQFQK